MPLSSRRCVVICCAIVLAVVGLPPAHAEPTVPRRAFERVDPSTLDQDRINALIKSKVDRSVDALVRLEAPAALERRADQRSLSRPAARRATEASQTGVLRRLSQLGARDLGRLTTVINAVHVRLPASAVARVRALPGVRDVEISRLLTPSNSAANHYTGVDGTWQSFGLTGRGQTIGIIDSGIDYTHADFGGPGTVQAYRSNNRGLIEAGTFPTAKVVGGYDLVGDYYNPGCDPDECPGASIPVADPDPLDCGGHGTHVAGTAAGSGVTAAGASYAGPYDASVNGRDFSVQPGAAPQAKLRAYKVFGCEGSTDSAVVVEAIDRAVADGVDVINMSLGSSLGTAESMETIAIEAATQAGVLVVVAGGNDGAGAYLVGGPGTANHALSVAAVDAQYPTLPGVAITGAVTLSAAELTGAGLSASVTGRLVDAGRGCLADNYEQAAGAVVIARRGICPFLDRPRLAAAAGAAALIMINDEVGYPPVVGPLPGSSVPFLGVRTSDGPALRAAAGQTVTLAAGPGLSNPTYGQVAALSSAGPRRGDSAPKPDLAAPGVSIPSARVGTGTGSLVASGTSMASPHVAGIAALVAQAHPTWGPEPLKAVLMSTASPSRIVGADRDLAGAGLVQPQVAAASSSYAWTTSGLDTLAFGMEQLSADYLETQSFKITNTSLRTITYDLSADPVSPAGAVVTISPKAVAIPAGETRTVQVSLSLDAAAIANLPGASAADAGRLPTLQGSVVATPRGLRLSGTTLRMGFLLVPVPLSDVRAQTSVQQLRPGRYENIKITNAGPHRGTADLFAWMFSDPAGDVYFPDAADIVSFGVQAVPASTVGESADDRLVIFAANLAQGASTHVVNEVAVAINLLRPDKPEYYTYTLDRGVATGGSPDGALLAITFSNDGSGDLPIVDAWAASAPANGSTILMPVLASRVEVDASYPLMELSNVAGFSTVDLANPAAQDLVDGRARFNPFSPLLSQGDILALDPGESSSIPVTVNPAQLGRQTANGWLVVSPDDAAGRAEGDRVRLVLPTGTTARRTG